MVELLGTSNGIKIWLAQPQFMVGELITGSVYLDVGSVPADNLTLFLKGIDELTIWKRHLKRDRRYFKRENKMN